MLGFAEWSPKSSKQSTMCYDASLGRLSADHLSAFNSFGGDRRQSGLPGAHRNAEGEHQLQPRTTYTTCKYYYSVTLWVFSN